MVKGKKKIFRSLKGFTLIELLIVIIIIGVLATIMIVSYNSATAKAKQAATIQILNDATAGAAICLAAGGTIATPVAGATICGDSTITNAKWASATSNGYTTFITGAQPAPTIVASGQYAGMYTYGFASGAARAIVNSTSTYGIQCTPTGCYKDD